MVSSTTFVGVTLKTDAGEEFKVNGQRLKQYLSREKEKGRTPAGELREKRLKTASPAKDSKQSSSWEATHIDFCFFI